MKVFAKTLLVFTTLMAANVGFADDYAAWVNKCKKDIDPEGNTPEVVEKWCSCMTGKMDVNETLSVLAWVKGPGKKYDEACGKEAGWVDAK